MRVIALLLLGMASVVEASDLTLECLMTEMHTENSKGIRESKSISSKFYYTLKTAGVDRVRVTAIAPTKKELFGTVTDEEYSFGRSEKEKFQGRWVENWYYDSVSINRLTGIISHSHRIGLGLIDLKGSCEVGEIPKPKF